MKKILTILFAFITVQVGLAQNIIVENFKHHKHYFWQINSSLPLDKKNATLVFKTEDKDFKFSTVKGDPLGTEESDEGTVLRVPDKTKYILISHPESGEYAWRVPEKYLKKHNFYSADLNTIDFTKEFKNKNQWVVFHISPENSIVTIDSIVHKINNGELSLYLPVGNHSFSIESPFYESVCDSIFLTDSTKLIKNLYLQPLYSYLSIDVMDPLIDIYVNNELQGKNSVTVGRLREGDHRVSLLKNNQWIKDTIINLDRAEKKNIVFPDYNLFGRTMIFSEKIEKNPYPNVYREITTAKKNPLDLIKELENKHDTIIFSEVHLIAEDSLSKIFIDREFVAQGEWKGEMAKGFHMISTEKDGVESPPQFINVKDSSPLEFKIITPTFSQGMLNVTSNVDDAEIIINGEKMGVTPSLIKGIAAGQTHTLTLLKEGYEEKEVNVQPKNNTITDLHVKLKKK